MKILLLAGEESGLLYARRLRASLEGMLSGETLDVRGYETEGFRTSDLAVMGFLPVLCKLFFFLRVARTMKRLIASWRPDAVVTIDYPGLNLKLAAYAKARGIPAVHVVCPQVWAWHRNRIPKIEAALTRLLCFFPFEPALFRPGFAAFIGHPMADVFREEAAARPPVARERGLVALLPGSRTGEIRRILPRLVAAAAGLDWRIPAVHDGAHAEIVRVLAACGVTQAEIARRVQRGGARDLLRRARCAAVASGTATLEAALAGCPTVLVYAVSPSLACFARHVIREIRHIGIVNVIAEKASLETPTPELLQENLTARAVRTHLDRWLTDEAAHAETVAALARTTALLVSDGDALGNAARAVLGEITRRRQEKNP